MGDISIQPTFAAQLQERQQLMTEINNDLRKINKDYEDDQENMDLARIQRVMKNLLLLNANIENQKKELRPSVISVKVLKIMAVTWGTTMLGLLAVQLYHNFTTERRPGESVAIWLLPSFLAIGTIGEAFLVFGYAIVMDKRNHEIDDVGTYYMAAQINTMLDEKLKMYIDALKELKEKENADEDEITESVNKCVNRLNDVCNDNERCAIDKEKPYEIFKDVHNGIILSLTPNSHPIKKVFKKLKKITKPTKTKTRTHGSKKKDDANKFNAEKDGVDSVTGNKKTDSDSDALSVLPNKKTRHRETWKALETAVKIFKLDKIRIHGKTWCIDGEEKENVVPIPAASPQLIRESISTSEDSTDDIAVLGEVV